MKDNSFIVLILELLYNDGYREIVDPDNIHRCVLEQHITAPVCIAICTDRFSSVLLW